MAKTDIIFQDRIFISQKRSIYIKLRSVTSEQYGESIFIEIQEVKHENQKLDYGQPLRIPVSEKSLLLAEIIRNFVMEGRKARKSTDKASMHSSDSKIVSEEKEENPLSEEEIANQLYENFKGQQVIKSNINKFLADNNITGNIGDALGILLEQKKVYYTEKVSKSGNRYQLWTFKE